MNKIAIIAALAVGGSLFGQAISYGVNGQSLVSINPGAVTGTFSASYASGTLTVSGSGTYYSSAPDSGQPSAPVPSLSFVVSGPVTFQGAATVNSNGATEDGFWEILSSFSFLKNDSQAFSIPSGLFTVTLNEGATPIAAGTFTVVPEPETYAAAAALGLVGFAVVSRRIRKA